jgi:hypothetical protein
MNPFAWLDCGDAVLERDVTYFVKNLYMLSFHHMLQNQDSETCASALSPFSPYNWSKLIQKMKYR